MLEASRESFGSYNDHDCIESSILKHALDCVNTGSMIQQSRLRGHGLFYALRSRDPEQDGPRTSSLAPEKGAHQDPSYDASQLGAWS